MLRFAQGCVMAALAGTMFGADGVLDELGRGGKTLMTLFLVIVLALLTPSLFPDNRRGNEMVDTSHKLKGNHEA